MDKIFENLQKKITKLGIVGLGYVGLPLAYAFAKRYNVVGYDYNLSKIELLRKGIDPTGEVPEGGLRQVKIEYTNNAAQLAECNFIVVAVPTPVNENNAPDLTPLIKSSEAVGKFLKKGTIVVYESTVYPGVTEDVCVPILEHESGLLFGKDFAVGYSPERINPGDKEHRLENIVKIVAGSDKHTLETVAQVYGSIIKAGLHLASSIKVAEAAKVIENTQRDVNIALMNELAVIFHLLGISTSDVLAAAGTKWNFLKFTPGLVGGHCIGVDPYYLTFKAEQVGYHPEVILAGRRINDSMGKFIANNLVKEIIKEGQCPKGSRVLVLGLTFKENVGDLRNSKVVDILQELQEFGIETFVHDPLANKEEAQQEYGVELYGLEHVPLVDAIILAVAHDAFRALHLTDMIQWCSNHKPILVDVKCFFDLKEAEQVGFHCWRL